MAEGEYVNLINSSSSEVRYTMPVTVSTIRKNERLKRVGESIRSALSVDKSMIMSKVAYIFIGMRNGALVVFMVIFLKSVGLSSSQAGIVYAVGFAGLTVGNCFWTALADRCNAHRLILWIVSILATLFLCSIPFLSLLLGKKSENTCGRWSQSSISTSDQTIISKEALVWVLTMINFCGYFCDGSTLSFIDTAVTRKITHSPRQIDFGRQRLFNSAGIAIGSLGGSILVDVLPAMPISCYIGLFFVYACSAVPGLAAGNAVFNSLPTEEKTEGQNERLINEESNEEKWRNTSLAEVITILCTSAVIGLLYSANNSFTMLYVRELGASNTMIGFCELVAALSAILTYFVSARMIELLRGEWNAICFCCATWAVRYALYVCARAPWLFLVMQFAHGVSFSLFIASLGRFIQMYINRRVFARFFGVTDAFINGTGPIVASVAGGYTYEVFGPNYLFGSMAVLSTMWLLTVIVCRIKNSF